MILPESYDVGSSTEARDSNLGPQISKAAV